MIGPGRFAGSKGEVHLAFLKNDEEWKSPADAVEKLLRTQPTEYLPAVDLPRFFTMRQSTQEYREIVRELGSDEAKELLLSMGDLVATKEQTRLPAWFPKAIASDQFTQGFTRQAETFFAFHNAGSVLAGLEAEVLSGISDAFVLKFEIPGFTNSHRLEFKFDHLSELPKRIAIIIGKNGVGKSQALSRFASALIHGDDKSLTDSTHGRPSVNRLVAVSSPGETYTTFPSPPSMGRRIDYRRVFLSKRQYGSSEAGLGAVLVQLVRSKEMIKGRSRWDLFCDIISTVLNLNEIYIELRARDFINKPGWMQKDAPLRLTDMLEGGEQENLDRWGRIDPLSDGCRFLDDKILPLSSGQITFLRFAAQTCLHIEKGTMLLCDEPETHLHPNYITEFMRLLDRLLRETGSFAILATHSAYFVREVPRSQVTVLRRGDAGLINVEVPRLRTLGADIGTISRFVFGDESFGFSVEQIRKNLKTDPKLLESLEHELSTEAWMNLKRDL